MNRRAASRALLVCTAIVGLGLLALKFPNQIASEMLCFAGLLTHATAIAIAFLARGPRRAFWVSFAVFATLFYLRSERWFPEFIAEPVWMVLHSQPDNIASSTDPMPPSTVLDTLAHMVSDEYTKPNRYFFHQTLSRLSALVIAIIAACIIPWLVQRGEKPSGD